MPRAVAKVGATVSAVGVGEVSKVGWMVLVRAVEMMPSLAGS